MYVPESASFVAEELSEGQVFRTGGFLERGLHLESRRQGGCRMKNKVKLSLI